MKKKYLLALTVAIVLIISGCKKINALTDNIPPPSNTDGPIQTDVGTPVGGLVTKTIGKEGGSISSEDGNADLIFPAGALADTTSISVQAITNTAPNGIRNSYRFLPEGIKFLKPVTLKFHYTAEDLAATLADLMGIAYQDSTGGWWRVNNFTNDTVNKIILAPITHFSIWTAFDLLFINPPSIALRIGKSTSLEVQVVVSDDLTDLGSQIDVSEPIVKRGNTKPIVWAVNGVNNGNSTSGTVAASSLYAATYTAPAKVPSQNPVAVSASIDANFKYHGKTFGMTSLISSIRIVDEEVYLVELKILDTLIDFAPDYMIVWDSVSMKVTIRDTIVTISEFTNFPSKATPTQLLYPHSAYYFEPDGIGEINITGGTGRVGPYVYGNGDKTRLLGLIFVQTGTRDPKYKYIALDNGDVSYEGGNPNQGWPLGWAVELLPDGEPANNGGSPNGFLEKIIMARITLQK